MKKKNKSLYQANSAKKMQAYRARKLAKKQGISYENALSLIEGELREIDKKTEIAQKKKGTTKPKFRKGKNPTREEVELFAKKERVNVGHAFLILRGQWTL